MSDKEQKKLVVGVTGIPGSGKTALVQFLAEKGADIVDVDVAGKWAIDENTRVREQIKETFGKEYFRKNILLRKKLGALIFADEVARKKLNAIVHPVMLARVDDLIKQFQFDSPNSIIIVDAALLFELNIDKKCDKTITVRADLERCIQRSMERDNITREVAIQRIQSQISQQEKKQRADIVVENNGVKVELKKVSSELFTMLLENFDE